MYGQFYNPYAQPYQMPQEIGQYRQQVPQIQQQVMQPQTMPQDERIWVQGESSAQAYLVAPNSFVRLWDSTRPVFYEKRADASGKPSIVAYEYHSNEIKTEEKVESKNNFADQIKNINERLNAIEERMDEYEQDESYDDDATVSEIPERIPRKSAGASRKTGARG